MSVSGIDPFRSMDLPTPSFVTYAHQNKVSFCLMSFFVGNLIESQLLSTGAFEVYFNDMPIWSKLDSQRIPQPHELIEIIKHQMELERKTSHFKPHNPSHFPHQTSA
ncbi:unnamed protein product [Dicrocoelium dendriticum]|nr:unnamed protein product [Dicrocoelium dendriticum]